MLPDGLDIAAVLPREDPRDALVLPARDARRGRDLATALAALGETPSIGTSSVRRIAQLASAHAGRAFRRRFAATSTRGCASSTPASTTRWCSPPPGCAGSASAARISAALPLDVCVPAPGQGIVAIEISADDDETRGRGAAAARSRRRRGAARPSARWSRRSAAAASCRSARIAVH